MKLAEALMLRADTKKRIDQLAARLVRSAKVQEGDAPPEEPRELIADLERGTAELTDLIRRINRTNAATSFADGSTLSDALAERDTLALKAAAYRNLAQAAVVAQDRYSKSEVRFRSTVSVAETQRRADGLSKEFRELDARIQATNWLTDLE
jgi:hypothetical protein